MRALADHEADTGDTGAAFAIYEDLLKKIFAGHPEAETNLQQATALSCIYTETIHLCRRTGRDGQASELESRLINSWKHWDARLPNNNFVHRQLDAAKERCPLDVSCSLL
jgi:hypothetical protein